MPSEKGLEHWAGHSQTMGPTTCPQSPGTLLERRVLPQTLWRSRHLILSPIFHHQGAQQTSGRDRSALRASVRGLGSHSLSDSKLRPPLHQVCYYHPSAKSRNTSLSSESLRAKVSILQHTRSFIYTYIAQQSTAMKINRPRKRKISLRPLSDFFCKGLSTPQKPQG